MNELRISLVQAELYWEKKEENLKHLQELISEISATDIIILPEMFSTGFSMEPHNNYENTEGAGLLWMKARAAETNAAICGSLIVKEAGHFYNRLYFVDPEGEVHYYDKRHLFTLAGEHKLYTPGNQRLLIEYKGWKILPYICYDLRFPVWCRNVEEAELMIFVANWPEKRSTAWNSLLKARAIENMCYVAAVNRIGTDGNDIPYSGDTSVYDEMGELVAVAKPGEEQVITVKLNKEKVLKSRIHFSFLDDRDNFLIKT